MNYSKKKIKFLNELIQFCRPENYTIFEKKLKNHSIVVYQICHAHAIIRILKNTEPLFCFQNTTSSEFGDDFVTTLNKIIPINKLLDEVIYELL